MSEIESNQVDSTSTEDVAVVEKKSSGVGKYVAAFLVVGIIILGVLYVMEKEDRSPTNIFWALIEQQFLDSSVAMVNGAKITNADLNTGVEQFSQMAAAQGVDTTHPEAQAEIRRQALDVLINTKLLKQTAEERAIEITDEVVSERLEAIRAELGGAEVLAERMAELGISEDKLFFDVKDELLIQNLLDAVFAEKAIAVTEEELQAAYDTAASSVDAPPPFSEVREVMAEQVKAEKEQKVIDDFLTELKAAADIEISEES